MNGRRARALRAIAVLGPGPDRSPGPGRAQVRATQRELKDWRVRTAAENILGRSARSFVGQPAAESTRNLLAAAQRKAAATAKDYDRYRARQIRDADRARAAVEAARAS